MTTFNAFMSIGEAVGIVKKTGANVKTRILGQVVEVRPLDEASEKAFKEELKALEIAWWHF